MRQLPEVHSLQEAVRKVIESNLADGYRHRGLMLETHVGYAPELVAVCERIITNPETLERLDGVVARFPNLLTLEDFVARQGRGWGISAKTVQEAKARVKHFDGIAGEVRYG